MGYCFGVPHTGTMNTAKIAGRAAGTIARYALWIHRNTDWAEVGAIVIHGLKVLVVLTLLAGRATRAGWDALPSVSEQLGRWYASKIAPLPAFTIAAVPAVLNIRATLERLPQRELMALAGTRRKLSKATLIAQLVGA